MFTRRSHVKSDERNVNYFLELFNFSREWYIATSHIHNFWWQN